jgi:hypothetical protein
MEFRIEMLQVLMIAVGRHAGACKMCRLCEQVGRALDLAFQIDGPGGDLGRAG